jgi:large subunit ribosomal protein L15
MNFDLSNLTRETDKPKRRRGRGYGSTNGGHTTGRGQKGQKSRSTVGPFRTGTKSNKDFFRKTPMLRGKGKLKSYNSSPIILKLSHLDIFKEGDTINKESLIKSGLITERQAKQRVIKVVFDKDINKKLKLEILASKAVSERLS